MGRIEYWHDPNAPKPNSLMPASNLLVVDDNRQILLQRRRDTGQWALPGRPISGEPTENDEASDVRWASPGDLDSLDIHPTQRRQIDAYLTGQFPHVD